MATETGLVEYGSRGFHQDASLAMRGDIVRGLIELITNCDDAYGDKKGKIRVEVEHRRGDWKVIVRDRAHGMSTHDLRERIIRLAQRTSGFETGRSVRGNQGRGAKDLAAFGTVVFESICNDRYSKLTLKTNGHYELDQERRARKEDRQSLGIPKANGTVVTLLLSARTSCPRHSNLANKLSKHFQLRDIMADPKRDVQLVNATSGEEVTLRYTRPSLKVEFQEEIDIEGYPDASATVTIYRNPERYEDPSTDPYRPGGLLVKGRRAIYENTCFNLENDPHMGWFSGTVECTYIDDLAREYDDRLARGEEQCKENPFPIIRRDRDGLMHNHPFFRALAKAVEVHLRALVEAERQRARDSGAHESQRMRRNLNELGRALSRLINEDLRELDEEELPGPGEEVPPIRIIPEEATVYMGEDKTLTVQVREDIKDLGISVEVDPEGVVEVVEEHSPLQAHKKRSDVWVTQVKIRPLLADKETFLTVRCGDHEVVALIEVFPEREVVPVPVEPPETIQFERDRYRVAWGKKRQLKVEASVDLVAELGKELRVFSSDPGVVVLGGGAVLELDDELEYYTASITVEARTLGATAMITAQIEQCRTTCNVIVSKDTGGNMVIHIADEEAGSRRALVEQSAEGMLVKIMGRHPALRRYLGPAPEFPHQDRAATCALVAEIVAGEATRMVMERKYRSGHGRDLDAAALYADHAKYLNRYLTKCHRALFPESSLTS